ncbi:MAG: hypothetical protein ABMB14_08520 [Myxococcota bacterium]
MFAAWLLGVAHAGPLDDALHAVDAQRSVQPATLDTIRATTRPPSALSDLSTPDAQIELSIRWGTLRDQADCQLFDEMHEVARRSSFRVTRAPALSRPASTGAFWTSPPDPLDAAVRTGVERIVGAPWTATRWPFAGDVFGRTPASFLVGTRASMAEAAQWCPSPSLLTLRDEVVAAGVGELPSNGYAVAAQPGELTIADALEVAWALIQTKRPDGDVPEAEALLVELLQRRGNSSAAVAASRNVQSGIADLQRSRLACSGHHCSEVLSILVAARAADPKVLSVADPTCATIAGAAALPPFAAPVDAILARRSASTHELEGPPGLLAYELYAMGCVTGEPPQFRSIDDVRAAVAAMPAACAPSSGTGLTDLLGRLRAGIVAGCVADPWLTP